MRYDQLQKNNEITKIDRSASCSLFCGCLLRLPEVDETDIDAVIRGRSRVKKARISGRIK